jgi:hypothetical protein
MSERDMRRSDRLVLGTPPRAPGSVRRTTSIDMLSPDGLDGDLVATATARDLFTDALGKATVIAFATADVRIDRFTHQVLSFRTEPELPALEGVVGKSVVSGFRRSVDAAFSHKGIVGSRPLYQLLDDLPGATLVSPYAALRAGVAVRLDDGQLDARVGLCAGWAEGSYAVNFVRSAGQLPVSAGATAPRVEQDDPLAWHTMALLPPLGMRRLRRIDVAISESDMFCIDARFRDSHCDENQVESILHEYAVAATADATTAVVVSATADPGVLPFGECPAAVGSASRVIGQRLQDLRPWVRDSLTGTSTCTHLNDTLRALADVPLLAQPLIGTAVANS